MTTLSFATSKGGAGKTTSAIILGTTLARKGHLVTLIDADPAARLMEWHKKTLDSSVTLKNLTVLASEGESTIADEIEWANSKSDFVLIDLEGAATMTNSVVMAESDLVLLVMGDEQQDAQAVIETVDQIGLLARMARREIPFRVLFARTEAGRKNRLAQSLNEQVRRNIGSFSTEFTKRMAYSALHADGGDLYHLDPKETYGVTRAIENAELLEEELQCFLELLRPITKKEKHHG